MPGLKGRAVDWFLTSSQGARLVNNYLDRELPYLLNSLNWALDKNTQALTQPITTQLTESIQENITWKDPWSEAIGKNLWRLFTQPPWASESPLPKN